MLKYSRPKRKEKYRRISAKLPPVVEDKLYRLQELDGTGIQDTIIRAIEYYHSHRTKKENAENN